MRVARLNLQEIFMSVFEIVFFYPELILKFNYFFFFQAEDGIRDCLLSRGLGDVYKRQDY